MKMMHSVVLVLVFAVCVSGCQKKEEGPMEQTGKNIDQSVEAAKDTAKEAGQAVKEGDDKSKLAAKDAVK